MEIQGYQTNAQSEVKTEKKIKYTLRILSGCG